MKSQSDKGKLGLNLLFQNFIEQTPVSIQIHSLNGKLINSNPAFSKLYGLSEKALTELYEKYNVLQDRQIIQLGVMSYIQRAFAGETVAIPEYKYDVNETLLDLGIKNAGSKTSWIRTKAFPLKDDQGNIAQVVFISEDITTWKKAEDEINQLYLLSGDLIAVANFEGYFTQLNPAWEATLGYTPNELMAKPFLAFIHPDDHTKNDAEIEKLESGHKTIDFENRYIHKDGSIRHISWTATPLPEEETIYCIGRDITERKIVEEALVENEEKFRLLVEQSPLPILIFNPDGFLDQVNLSWQNMWGLSDIELQQVLDHFNVLGDEMTIKYGHMPLIIKAFNGEPVVLPLVEYDGKETMDRFGKKIDAKKVWIIARYYPVKNKKGTVVKVVGMVENYTERKLWEQETLNYQQSLKDLALELTYAEEKQRKQIAADLHDDVGQLLASSRIQIATINPSMDKSLILNKVQEVSDGLRDAIMATQQAIFDLRPHQLNDIGLEAALADWMEEELEAKHGITTILLGEDKKYEFNDEVRYLLYRCIRELLINVIKHAQASKVIVGFAKKNKTLSISVHDNGIGIDYDPSVIGSKGSGFGLFSIRERIQNIGGALLIESVKGTGTKITLTLATSK